MRKNIASALTSLIKPLGLVALRKKDLNHLENRMKVLSEMITGGIHCNQPSGNSPAEGIVFSKDRAIQLDALLCSYREMAKNPAPLHLLYAASSDRHRKAYAEVIEAHRSQLSMVEEQTCFKSQVVSILDRITAPTVFFLVDDIVFVRLIDFKTAATLPCASFVVSLRLAPHLTRCYTQDKEQPVPDLAAHDSGMLIWRWSEGVLDWGYPLSLDGHFFSTVEMRAMTRYSGFTAPNSLEHALQEYNDLFLPRFGACFKESRIVNIPFNKVQTENQNRSGGLHQDALLAEWENGNRIDYKKYFGTMNESAHQELPINFTKRV